jgi:hypothetical protein
LLLGDIGYQVQSESTPEVAVEENMLSDSSFDPTDGITCADINAEPVGAECVCKYGFKDFGVGCRRTQPLTLLRILVETDTKDWRLIDFENFAHVA